MNTISIEEKVCIISVQTLQKLFEYGSDPVALYVFYYKQCKMQKTNQSWTTDAFVMKGLGRGRKKLQKAKEILKKEKLVEKIITRDEKGKIIGHFIKLNYIRGEYKSSHLYQKQQVDAVTSGGQPTNALSDIKRNAGSDIKEKKYIKKGFEDFRKQFPHARSSKKQDAKKHYNNIEYSQEEIHCEIMYLKYCIHFGFTDPAFVKGCALRLRDFVKINDKVKEQNFKKMIYSLMENRNPELAIEIRDFMGYGLYRKFVKEYNKEFNSIVLK